MSCGRGSVPRTRRAINLPHFKNRLKALSRELYLENGWKLPEGLRRDGGKSPLNFTLAEWQQAKRLGCDPREIKEVFRNAWEKSDSLKALGAALAERGYFLAKGDRRGLVAIDVEIRPDVVDDNTVRLVVRDSGIGIRPEALRSIFRELEGCLGKDWWK